MELDVSMDNDSLSIPVDNPFHLDLDLIGGMIEGFAASRGARLDGLDVKGLLPGMVKGIKGCEAGCPANAMDFVSRGFRNFELAYIEGGILIAKAVTKDGKALSIKVFPDF